MFFYLLTTVSVLQYRDYLWGSLIFILTENLSKNMKCLILIFFRHLSAYDLFELALLALALFKYSIITICLLL